MDKDKISGYRQLAIATTIPIILVVAPLLGYYLGVWVDKKLGTGKVFMIVGLALGFGAAAKEIYGMIKKSTDGNK
jgi:ATP synthase protein I